MMRIHTGLDRIRRPGEWPVTKYNGMFLFCEENGYPHWSSQYEKRNLSSVSNLNPCFEPQQFQ